MSITVHLHGPYRSFHRDPISIVAETAAEVIQAVTTQNKGFRPTAQGMKRVQVVGFDTAESLHAPLEDGSELHLMPPVHLSEKNQNVVQIVVGVVLIIIGVAMGGTTWPEAFILLGGSMVIGGVMNLLMPVPKYSQVEEDKTKYLGSPPNTVGTGVRIPFGHGMDLVQGHILSSDIDATETA